MPFSQLRYGNINQGINGSTTVTTIANGTTLTRSLSRQNSVVMTIPERIECETDIERESLTCKPPHYYELERDEETKSVVNRLTISVSSDAAHGLITILSAIYAKLVIVIGLCFPMAEVISHRIPIGWYEGFYLYLYTGSIFFLTIVYASQQKYNFLTRLKKILCWTQIEREPDEASSRRSSENSSVSDFETNSPSQVHFGSFYLRLGAVAFGIGSMIYSGLEFGQYFELESKEHCYSFLYGFTPTIHMIFTFFQLYFIFMNSNTFIVKHNFIARLGLMHMISTNLCTWLHVLIQETKHQILLINNINKTSIKKLSPTTADSKASFDYVFEENEETGQTLTYSDIYTTFNRTKRSVDDHIVYTTHGHCRRSNVIGQLVKDASQFLFPCTIEYSLICAAVLYVMWKHASNERLKRTNSAQGRVRNRSLASTSTVNHHQKHYYQVDCAKAHKGLFCGIFLLVVCIISLILFFVLIKKPNYRNLGVLQAHVVELAIYSINAIACVIAIIQVKGLRYNKHHNIELDNILLIVAQIGLYAFNMFSVIGSFFFSTKYKDKTQLVLINAFVCIIQATLQSVFILDASRRYASTPSQIRKKPAREVVTFLLVCNFAMWAINTLETRRADSNPVQMHFYGFWAWTIITHVTTPLTIFYRFHSTVCLCDIWKRTYKLR